jgi:hypothetical protein
MNQIPKAMKDLYRLQDIIADEAIKYFQGQAADYDKMKSFVINLTSVSDWHPQFYYGCFVRYMTAKKATGSGNANQNQA